MSISLDFYLLCLEVAAANLVVAALLLFTLRKARNRKANVVLGMLLLALAATFLSDVLFLNRLFQHVPHLLGYDEFLFLLQGPLLYLYILYQTQPHFRLRFRHGWHLMPLVGYFVLFWTFFTADGASKLADVENNNWTRIPYFTLVSYLIKMQLFLYGIACYRLLRKHNQTIRELVSSLEHRKLQWLRHLLVASAALLLVWTVTNVFDLTDEPMGLVILVISYWLTYHAISQEHLFEKVSTEQVVPILEEAPNVRYRNSTLSPEDLQRHMTQVEQYMREVKPHLDSELTLTALAQPLALNPYYLSQILNEGFQENFYKFINRHRVEESKRLLLDPAFSHYTILAIANEAGFTSKSTFNRTFKEHTGLAPSEFIRQHQPG